MPKTNDPEDPRPYDEGDETDLPAARPIPVGGPVGVDPESDDDARAADDGYSAVAAEGDPTAPADATFLERPTEELAAGIAGLVLAASVFLPWYEQGTVRSVTGWSSGTWGPVVFFLGLAAFGVVLLRRLRVPLSFPVEHSLVIEAIGWVSVIGVIVKRFLRPDAPLGGDLGATWLTFVPLLAGVSLALLGSRISGGGPVLVRPNWAAEPGAKLGIGLLGVALLAGAGFGLTNDSFESRAENPTPTITPIKGFPKCAREKKIPNNVRGLTATQGLDYQSVCSATFETDLTVNQAFARYTNALKAAGFTFRAIPNAQGQKTAQIMSPECGIVSSQARQAPGASPSPRPGAKTQLQVFLTPCPEAMPSTSK